jgi:hypothetical protein
MSLEVADTPGETVNSRDHQHVAPTEEIENGLQLGSAGSARATPLLGSDDFATGGPKRGFLNGEVLVDRAHLELMSLGKNGHSAESAPFRSQS